MLEQSKLTRDNQQPSSEAVSSEPVISPRRKRVSFGHRCPLCRHRLMGMGLIILRQRRLVCGRCGARLQSNFNSASALIMLCILSVLLHEFLLADDFSTQLWLGVALMVCLIASPFLQAAATPIRISRFFR